MGDPENVVDEQDDTLPTADLHNALQEDYDEGGHDEDKDDAMVSDDDKTWKALDEEHLGFFSLAGRCPSKWDGQYTYKICFFDSAMQGSVLLGSWKGWTGPKEALFTDGNECPGGLARQCMVEFQCGESVEVLDIMEPSRCYYKATVSHPGAC